MWETRVAKKWQQPLSYVQGLSWPDLVSAVTDLVDDAERCTGCGLSEADAWWVAAELEFCPTCKDAAVTTRNRPKSDKDDGVGDGFRTRFVALDDATDSAIVSSASRFTPEGMAARKRAIDVYRAASQTDGSVNV